MNRIPLNWALMSNPLNWLIAMLMVAIGGLATTLLINAATPQPDEKESLS